MPEEQGKVYIVGGGPGDPELLTLKAKSVIESADVVIYADSLVHPSIVEFAKPGAEVHGSKTLNLDQIMELTLQAVRDGKTVARIQSGDPAIYGAILEQMRILEEENVDYEIIPGVSSAFAAAARLKVELTVPGGSQTVIMTRAEGRIAMPPGEKLRDLAAHGSTLVIFLSVTRMVTVVRQLLDAGYTEDSPVADSLPRRMARRASDSGYVGGYCREGAGSQNYTASLDNGGPSRGPGLVEAGRRRGERSKLFSPLLQYLHPSLPPRANRRPLHRCRTGRRILTAVRGFDRHSRYLTARRGPRSSLGSGI